MRLTRVIPSGREIEGVCGGRVCFLDFYYDFGAMVDDIFTIIADETCTDSVLLNTSHLLISNE